MLPLTTFYRSGAHRSDVYKWDAFVTSWRFYTRAWQPQRHDRLPKTSGTLWILRGALTNQRCSLVSQEPSLGFEPTSLRLPESAVQHSTHRATRVLRRRGRQSLIRRLPHYSPFFFYFWVVPVCLGPPPLPALTPDRSPPRPPILARLDPRTSCLVRLGPQSWPALAPDRCPPWPTILARLDLLWASTQKFQAGIVQYNQFAVDAGTSDTKCRRSRRWDSNPRRCDCLSQPSSTRVLRRRGRQSLIRRLPH